MIKTLTIDQFVIIERSELVFETGLTILTGETGAGKSIILAAMNLVLGGEARYDSVRQGAERTTIEAVLNPPPKNPAWKVLVKNDLAEIGDDEYTVKRVFSRDGEEEITLNNKKIDVELLQEIAPMIMEIHGQFANQSMTDPENQLTWLDLFGNYPPEILGNVAEALRDVRKCEQDLEEEKVFLARHLKELKTIESVVTTLEKIGIREGFVEEVDAEYKKLLIAKDTSDALQSILSQLIASNGVVSGLANANTILERQENVEEEKIEALEAYLEDALQCARDAVEEIGVLSPQYDIDTDYLQKYKDILDTLHSISEEHKVPFDDLYPFYEKQAAKLKRIRRGKARIQELDDYLIKAKETYRHHAHILSGERTVAARALGQAITNELPPLKLMKAEFEVLVEEKPKSDWTERGYDTITYRARMNPGSPFSSISETASGGEMARLILALKVILQDIQKTPTLVFDEVDTGIGGAAAAAVGERIALLADTSQVLVITHSPQVASRGMQHWHVSKKTDGQTTKSGVDTLSMDERIEEISRMLAGDITTPESKAAATSLIGEAQKSAEERKRAREQGEAVPRETYSAEEIESEPVITPTSEEVREAFVPPA